MTYNWLNLVVFSGYSVHDNTKSNNQSCVNKTRLNFTLNLLCVTLCDARWSLQKEGTSCHVLCKKFFESIYSKFWMFKSSLFYVTEWLWWGKSVSVSRRSGKVVLVII